MTDDRQPARSKLLALFEPLRAFDDVFLAVSGGADSTALMHLVAQWRDDDMAPPGKAQPLRFTVLAVDHGLRVEAASEAECVRRAARHLGFAAEVLTWEGAAPPKTAVQQTARQIRDDLLLAQARKSLGRAVILMAHHQGDLAETVLMRLARGAGVDGLSAMQLMMEIDGVAVFRPLLTVPKSRLMAILEAQKTRWIEDPSNENVKFERVKLRQAGAAREALGLGDGALALTARRMGRARRALERWTERELAGQLAKSLLARCGVFEWPWKACELEDEIAIRLLQRILPAISGRSEPVRLERLERLHAMMQRADFNGATLGHCVISSRQEGGSLLIYREPHRETLPVDSWDLGEPMVWDNRFVLRATNNRRARVQVRAFRRDDLASTANKPSDL